jgi:hypothetical protein
LQRLSRTAWLSFRGRPPNGHGVSATLENQYGTKSVAAAMTVSRTPALSQWARVTRSALRATFIVRLRRSKIRVRRALAVGAAPTFEPVLAD